MRHSCVCAIQKSLPCFLLQNFFYQRRSVRETLILPRGGKINPLYHVNFLPGTTATGAQQKRSSPQQIKHFTFRLYHFVQAASGIFEDEQKACKEYSERNVFTWKMYLYRSYITNIGNDFNKVTTEKSDLSFAACENV